ncbi:uncharacterized protein [Nicotiana sylvestris]|uniref:uncharacterized protein n=1 Tax=Nicotiana sylvestris TaxID=4096 RepID=UPI00388CACE6
MDKQLERFLEMLRHVNVNLPFTEVISQIPAYAKFLKDIITNKRKIEEMLVVKVIEHYSAIFQDKLLQNKQIKITLEGIVEEVLVRVDKFIFPVDFTVVKMEENKEISLILGRTFLEIGRAILDIHERNLMLRVGEETVTFEMTVEKD